MIASDGLGDLYPVNPWHLYVEHGNVRRELSDRRECLSPVSGLADQLKLRPLGDPPCQTISKQRMIIGEEHPNTNAVCHRGVLT